MSVTERLGNTTNFHAARVENVTRRYRLLDVARELLPDFRVSQCLHVPIPGQEIGIYKEVESGHAHQGGVGRCGSVWVCPVCSAKISLGRAAEIEEAVRIATEKGWYVVFTTLTSRHDRSDMLADIVKRVKASLSFMRSSRRAKKIREKYGFVGRIDASESNWGFSAGWHFHGHDITFYERPPDVETLEDELYQQWQHALGKQGLDCDREHGVKVLMGTEHLPGYLTKWGLKNELASREKPGRAESYSPFQLLALYDAGESWSGSLFQEYADATKGVSSLRWSRGLRDVLGMRGEMTDQELVEAEESEGSVLLVTLSRDEYQRIIYSGRRGVIGEMLTVAELGLPELLAWLSIFGVSPPRDVVENSLHNTS